MKKIKTIFYLLRVIPKLGFFNVLYVAWYKLSLKFKIQKRLFKAGLPVEGVFFKEISKKTFNCYNWNKETIEKGDLILNGNFTYFSYHTFEVGAMPNWFYNPFDKLTHSQQASHWTEIIDFGQGDIKVVWELSRFDWLTDLARAYAVSGNNAYLARLNKLLNDWSIHNPLNVGPNWKCGQETSFRLMKLLTTAFILDQLEQPSTCLETMVLQHAERIEGNIMYGVAQDNNHGSSEAIGLYIGSAWLIKQGNKSIYLNNWKEKSRKLIEDRILKLIQEQGSFSQRSMTYHRVIVDSISFCLQMMNYLGEPAFDSKINDRLIALGEWQFKMTFGVDGDAPNYGSNDGARIENLYNNDYRDFRPSTQLFFGLLMKQKVYNDINVSEAMYWRCGKESLSFPVREISILSCEVLDKHIAILTNQRAKVFFKLPDDTFRPGNDAYHIDLWIDGLSVLSDTGSYSYNAASLTDRFKSVVSHNTVQFGDNEQMPKISRFLNGEWLKPYGNIFLDKNNMTISCSSIDFRSNKHNRTIKLNLTSLQIEDNLASNSKASSRFHITNPDMIRFESIYTSNWEEGENSIYYLQKSIIPVLIYSIPKGRQIVKVNVAF